jgi:hypothetical protein
VHFENRPIVFEKPTITITITITMRRLSHKPPNSQYPAMTPFSFILPTSRASFSGMIGDGFAFKEPG